MPSLSLVTATYPLQIPMQRESTRHQTLGESLVGSLSPDGRQGAHKGLPYVISVNASRRLLNEKEGMSPLRDERGVNFGGRGGGYETLPYGGFF